MQVGRHGDGRKLLVGVGRSCCSASGGGASGQHLGAAFIAPLQPSFTLCKRRPFIFRGTSFSGGPELSKSRSAASRRHMARAHRFPM